MEEKVRFVFEYEQDERTMTELCQRYGIARETGYVWLRRYRERGLEGLVELNRAAVRHGNQTAAETERAVLELRQAHMRWGPRKLKRVLERGPAAATLAGGEYDRRVAEARRVGGGAQAAAADCTLHGAAGACRRPQPGVVRGLQRLVPHRRWRARSIR